jgi:hypothetical protein
LSLLVTDCQPLVGVSGGKRGHLDGRPEAVRLADFRVQPKLDRGRRAGGVARDVDVAIDDDLPSG